MALYNGTLIVLSVLLIVFQMILNRSRIIKNARFKRTLNVFITIFVILMISAVLLFPNLKSISVTGEYSYTSDIVELTDLSRKEEFKNDGSPRILSLLVYYPAKTDLYDHSCPLIVFSHGGISTKTSNLSLYKELASHGYVVVSIDHTYHALNTKIGGVRIPIDPRYMKELQRENSNVDIENSYECFQKWMKLRTDDINFVIDSFIEQSVNENDSFYRLIDVNRIGVIGHSLGGSAALGAGRQRDDIKAVIALESPYMCDVTGISENEFTWNLNPYKCAVMNVYSDNGYSLIETDNKYVQNKNHLYNDGNTRYYYIEGSNHFTLTDLVRTSPILCGILGGRYKKSGYDTLKMINEICLDFIDEFVR